MPVNKYKVYDVLHKSVALGLITFTGVGTVWLGYKAFWWYSVRRPLLHAEQRRINEERIAAEQFAHEKELAADKEFRETLRS